MEKEYQKENTDNMFDFRKSNKLINEDIKKVEKNNYKKIIVYSVVSSFAFAAFLSIGLTAGNIVTAKLNNQLNADKLQTISQLQKQEKVIEVNNINQEKQIDFAFSKIKSIDKLNYTKFIDYLEAHQIFYDERLKVIRKSLFEAQIADRAHAVDPNRISKDLEVAIIDYKKDLEDVIIKTATIYSSVQENRVKENDININDMKKFLNLYDQSLNGLVIHNKFIDLKIKEILYFKNKANVDYNNSHDMFNTDEKTNQEAEKTIKKLKH